MHKHLVRPLVIAAMTCLALLLALGQTAVAADGVVTQEQFANLSSLVGIIWWAIMFALIFLMQAGFMLLEAGSVRAKTAAHIGAKIMAQIGLGITIFYFVGFAIKAYGWPVIDMLTGTSGWASNSTSILPWTFNVSPDMFIFAFFGSLMFMLTSLAIPGTVFSERMSMKGHIIFIILYAAIIYPVFGWLIWGGLVGSPLLDPNSGFLQFINGIFTPAVNSGLGQKLIEYGMVADATGRHFYAPFTDYAGSLGVHVLGGIVGLIGAIYLGPRIGKYVNGKARAIPGHNVPLAVLGALLLAFCWFGFNGGSVVTNLSGAGTKGLFLSDFIYKDIWWVIIVTTMSMAGGILGALGGSRVLKQKPDPLVIANGMLGALVAICAGVGFVHPIYGLIIGLIAGFQFPFTLRFVEHRLKIDDAIGTIPCHTASGIVGGIMAGIWGQLFWWGLIPLDWVHPGGMWAGSTFIPTFAIEIIGIAALILWAVPVTFAAFWLIDKLVGARVSRDAEMAGLDISEHGVAAYPEFDSKETFIELGYNGDNGSSAPVKAAADQEVKT